MEELTFGKEAREKLIEGINDLNRAVSSTMGPNGKTVIIHDEYNQPYVTKDGVSVARNIQFKDPIKNIGASLIKQAAEKTVNEAGDGTTTATVLATAFVNNLKDFDTVEINKAFDEIIPKVLEQLKLNSKELKNEDIEHVASISANNDSKIGKLIQQAYNHSRIVKVEESNYTEDKLIEVNGMQLDVTYHSKHFINNHRKGLCEFENPFVLILDGKLEKLDPFMTCFNHIANEKGSIVIITEHIHEQTLKKLEASVLSGNVELVAIKSPGFSTFRKDLLNDLADFTGAKVISDFGQKYNQNILGKLESIKVSSNQSLLVKHSDINIDSKLNSLEEYLNTELSSQEKDLIEKRIENLKGKVSIIKVGGKSELEVKERKDRYDDAVLAVACALEEGIVEGGGFALMWASLSLNTIYDEIQGCEKYILRSILEPKHIIEKSKNEQIIDMTKNMFEKNIIDPLKVTRCALENAVSIAKIILSTEAVVLNEKQWN